MDETRIEEERRDQEIEPQIKGLVVALSEIPYITTISSCEGHFRGYDRYMGNRYAHIMFEVPDKCERILETLIKKIMQEVNLVYGGEAIVNIHKRYYPSGEGAGHNWKIEIEPFDKVASPREKRRVTNKIIEELEKVVRDYKETL